MDGGASPQAPSSPGSDLASKYTKLASEYSKLRAQSGVLKKAVIEEQSKNVELTDGIRQRDQVLRKFESEMESVQFRNQQLSKRVEILQDELDKTIHKEMANKKGNRDNIKNKDLVAASENINSVFSEELKHKIDENARLHQRLSDIDKVYEEKIQSYQTKIFELESRLSKIHQLDRADDVKQKELITGLKVENVELLNRIQALESELADKSDRITVLQVQLESSKSSLASDSYSSKRHSVQNSNYLVLNSTEARIQTVELLSLLGEGVQGFVAAMSDFHTYWEHRLKDTKSSDGSWSCQSASRLSALLLQNVKHLKPIEEAYQKVLSDILSSQSKSGERCCQKFSFFAEHFSAYVDYVAKQVEPLVIDCLHKESYSPMCSPTQKAKNEQFQRCIRKYDQLLGQVAELLQQIVIDQEPDSNLIENFNVIVSKLHHNSVELFDVYSGKAVDENSLPTISRQLINTNQCIVTSLSDLASALNNVSRNLSENLPRLNKLLSVKFEDDEPAEVFTNLVSNQPFVDYSDCVSKLETQLDETKEEIGNLKHVSESLEEKLKKAVQEREHWKLESQLLQMKHDKLRDQSLDRNEDESDKDVKKMFIEKVDNLIFEKLESDSKATHFYLECVALQKRLKDRERAKVRAYDNLNEAKNEIQRLQDEMNLTNSTYEGQLSLMSEHVAAMNEKLAAQTDHIERLKYELSVKKKN